MLIAFGAQVDEGHSSKVLERDDKRLLVELHSHVRMPFGKRVAYRTVEWVSMERPERINFESVAGPLQLLQNSLALENVGGCTELRYESTFGVRWSVLGWIVGKLYVQPLLGRFMREHLAEMKKLIEQRACRSLLYPRPGDCPHAAMEAEAA